MRQLADVYRDQTVRDWPLRPWRKVQHKKWVACIDVNGHKTYTWPGEGYFTFVSRDTGKELHVRKRASLSVEFIDPEELMGWPA